MADDRIFRLSRELRAYWDKTIVHSRSMEYATRRELSGRLVRARVRTGIIVKVEATNAEATDGWTDVTSEFMEAI